jgi:hypothetical protein
MKVLIYGKSLRRKMSKVEREYPVKQVFEYDVNNEMKEYV